LFQKITHFFSKRRLTNASKFAAKSIDHTLFQSSGGDFFGIMMLQHFDAWEMPSNKAFQESLLGFAV